MTTLIGASVHVDPSEVRHDVRGSRGCLCFGPWPTVERLDLYFEDTAGIDKVIAELVALRAEMTEPPLAAPWTQDGPGTWRAPLPDGRTAVVERLDDGKSYLPKVHESASDFETGPVCAGLASAVQWCADREPAAARGDRDEAATAVTA